MASSQNATRKRQLVRPTGLTEALWACVLDDYLSEEEEGEISKVLGYRENAPWYLNPDTVACTPSRNTRRILEHDPRDPKERGGRHSDSSDEDRDGRPGVWDDLSSTTELPPVMWLSLPPSHETRNNSDWNISTGDWDMTVASPRERNETVLQRQSSKNHRKAGLSIHHQMSLKSTSPKSRQSSKSNTNSTSILSTPCGNSYAMAISRSSSQRSSPRSRSTSRAEVRRSRSKSQSRSKATTGSKKAYSEMVEERQPQSRRLWGGHQSRS